MTVDGDASLMDRIRDLVEGRLDPVAAAAVARAVAADPEGAALLAAYRAVHAASAGAGVMPPAPAFDHLLDHAPTRRAAGWWMAAAAAVIVAAGGGLLAATALRRAPEPAIVTLSALPLDAPAEPLPVAVPIGLADFRPVADGQVRWVESLAEGEALARATGRPILFFLQHPQCPLCRGLNGKAFVDPAVTGRVEGFIPVRLSVLDAPPEIRKLASIPDRWPYLSARDGEGKTLSEFPGYREADAMATQLGEALGTAPGGPTAPDWAALNRAAAALDAARAAEREGRLGDAHAGLTAAQDADGVVGASARAGLVRLARAAHAALAPVQAAAATTGADATAGQAALDTAARRFAGTPYEIDFQKIAAAWRERGIFPRLVSAAASAGA